MKKLTTDQFIEKSKIIHKNKNDYSKSIYVNSRTKICITCKVNKKHGDYWQSPNDHLQGSGCPKCKADITKNLFKSNKDEFIKKAFKIHSNKNDYSKFIYRGSQVKGCIICLVNETHGEYCQTPNDHLSGKGCPRCKADKLSNLKRFSNKEIIKRAIAIHGDKFGYNKVNRKPNSNMIEIYCNSCKKYFLQDFNSHLQGYGCSNCRNIETGNRSRSQQEDIIKRFREIHGDQYGYDNFIYKNIDSKSTITCLEHGDFEQTPYLHMNGYGCPKCSCSKGEKTLIRLFNKHNIIFQHQFKLPNYNRLRYDFYLPELNVLIEFHGGQHFFPVKWFGGLNGFRETQKRDEFKKSLAREYKIPIIYFTYKHLRMSKQDFEKFVLSIINKVLIKKIIL